MQVSLEKLGNNRVAVEVGLGPDEVDKALTQAYHKVARKVKVPGFRQGKVPRSVLEAKFGKEVLYDDAMEILVPEAYEAALQEHELEPIDKPDLTVVEPLEQGKNFVFKATVDVLPEVTLGKYTAISMEKPVPVVEESDVDRNLQELRERHAELVLAEEGRGLEKGDYAVVDFDGYVDGQPFPGGSAKGYTVDTSWNGYPPGFVEGMIGLKNGEERDIHSTLPGEGDQAGKEILFHVVLREIKHKELPELNDEFAKSLGEESMDALKERIRQNLKKAAEHDAEQVFAERIVHAVVENSKVEVPPVLATRQIDRDFGTLMSQVERQGKSKENYLAEIGKTEDEIKEELKPQAELKVSTDLILGAIRKAEKIEPTEDEIAQRIDEWAVLSGKDGVLFRADLSRSGGMEALKDGLAREKTIRFLTEKAVPVLERTQSNQMKPDERG